MSVMKNTCTILPIVLVCFLCSCGGQAIEESHPPASNAVAVAEEYYIATGQFIAKETREIERSNKSMWKEQPGPALADASGTVADRWGNPVPGADITISTEAENVLLGKGTTDANGNFQIPLSNTAYRGLALEVLAKGYERWAVSGVYGGIVDYPVRLSTEIDEVFLKKLCAETNKVQRLRMLLEVVGTRQMGAVSLEIMFPYLGMLRNDLRALISSSQLDTKDDGTRSPAQRAWHLLEYWCEPADMELARAKGLLDTAHNELSTSQSGPAGTTVEEILEKHASRVDMTKHPRPSYGEICFSMNRTRALVEVSMLYAHWGYTYYLVMARQDEQWHVVGRFDGMHMDFVRE